MTRRLLKVKVIDHLGTDFDEVRLDVCSSYPEDSLYFLDETKFFDSVRALQEGFLPNFPESRAIAYAVKANPDRKVIEILNRAGIEIFDCASLEEVRRVVDVAPDSTPIFHNPVKKRWEIAEAMERGVSNFTVQTKAEIMKILESAEQVGISVEQLLIEVRLMIEDSFADADDSDSRKFGADDEEALELLRFVKNELGAAMGISIYAGSQNKDPHAFETAIQRMSNIAASVGGVSLMNVGGGLPVDYHGEGLMVEDYFEVINDSYERFARPALAEVHQFLIETGRLLVAEAVDLIMPVLEYRESAGRKHIVIDGGVFKGLIDYSLYGWRYALEALGMNGRELSEESEVFRVFGRTCDRTDALGQFQFPEDLAAGDALWLPKAGAYISSQDSSFHLFSPFRRVVYHSCEAVGDDVDVDVESLKRRKYRFEGLTSAEITDDLVGEFAGFFRYIFSNAEPWNQYVVCPPCDQEHDTRRSAVSVYEIEGNGYVPLDLIDDPEKCIIPDCQYCGDKMKLVADPRLTFERLKEKLSKDAWVATMRDDHGRLKGAAWVYQRSLKEVFEMEEWGDPYYYADIEDRDQYIRSFEVFHRLISEAILRDWGGEGVEFDENGLVDPDTEVACTNCIIVDYDAMSQGNFWGLVNQLAKIIPPEKDEMYAPGESILGSIADFLFMRVGIKHVPGILKEGDILERGDFSIVLGKISTFKKLSKIS